MKRHIVFILLFSGLIIACLNAQESNEIRLLVRGNDIGMSHSANEACIEAIAYQDLFTEPKKKPNVIFLLIDDQRNTSLGCAGHPIIKTPVIDDLANEGVRFSNAFVTTSICAASRASIFTGMHERSHQFTFNTKPLSQEYLKNSYSILLGNAGYHTGFIGKYGVVVEGYQPHELFDSFRPLDRWMYFKKQQDGSERHITELMGDYAGDFLQNVPEGEPFCLSMSFNAAHAEDADKENHFPWPKVVDGMYNDVEIPEPRLSDPAIFDGQPDFLKNSMNRDRYYWRWDTPEKYQKNMRAYFRMISGIDRVIGRIRDELKQNGLDENTVIIYMGDNGYYMGDRGFAGKWSHYEESLRVPLIIYDPRLPEQHRGQVQDKMALNIDVPSTILDICGIDIPQQYEGRNLMPLVLGENPSDWRTDLFCEHLMETASIPKWEGVRDERYVYARYFEQEPAYEFLHDLETDPDQLKNFATDPDYSSILEELRTRCDELKSEYESNRK